MGRTTQMAMRAGLPMLRFTEEADHEEERIIRARVAMPDLTFPEDFQESPVFAFQVYSTVPIDLNDESEPREVRYSSGSRPFEANLTRLVHYLAAQVECIAPCPNPVFEIYIRKESVFACVEHQRREIAHRKAVRADSSTWLISRVPLAPLDNRRSGFIFVLTSTDFKERPTSLPSEGSSRGSLQMWFERALPPAVGSAWPGNRRDDVLASRSDSASNDERGDLPQQIDMRVVRVQKTTEEHRDAANTLRERFSHLAETTQMDFALDTDEGSGYTDPPDSAIETLQSVTDRFQAEKYAIEQTDEKCVIISNQSEDDEPDLRYLIYVPFLHHPALEHKLLETAKAFTFAVTSRLAGPTSISFEFRKPPTATLEAVLTSTRSVLAGKPADYLGARVVDISSTHHNSATRSEPGDPRQRLCPAPRSELSGTNLPANTVVEPYRTFAVVLDRPDFSTVPGGVRFLLVDGGQPLERPEGNVTASAGWSTEKDYVEMQVWRLRGIEEVAKSLEMGEPEDRGKDKID